MRVPLGEPSHGHEGTEHRQKQEGHNKRQGGVPALVVSATAWSQVRSQQRLDLLHRHTPQRDEVPQPVRNLADCIPVHDLEVHFLLGHAKEEGGHRLRVLQGRDKKIPIIIQARQFGI